MFEVLGSAEALHIGRTAARQIGMQYHDEVCARFGVDSDAPDAIASFATLLTRVLAACGEHVESRIDPGAAVARIRQHSWRFAAGLSLPPEGFEAWSGLWEGLAAVHGPANGVKLLATARQDLGDAAFEWRAW
jgi:hypothetical protein